MKKIAFVEGNNTSNPTVDLVVLGDDYAPVEVIRAVGPDMPFGRPDTFKVIGWSRGEPKFGEQEVCLVLEDQTGRCFKFRSTRSLLNPEHEVLDIVSVYKGQSFTVVQA